MAKKVFYDEEARERVLGGAKALYDAVKVTYGPKGRNVVIAKGYGGPTVTHDGVTVAESIDLPENDDETLGYKVGAELIKQAASKLNKVAGDGTTTVTVLTYNILKEANRLIAAGHNPQELRKARPVSDKATLSCGVGPLIYRRKPQSLCFANDDRALPDISVKLMPSAEGAAALAEGVRGNERRRVGIRDGHGDPGRGVEIAGGVPGARRERVRPVRGEHRVP